MNIPMLRACIEGYQEHLFDMQCIAVHQGYWAGYYQSKKPKPANAILKRMVQDHARSKARQNNRNKCIQKPAVDVERFLKLEAKRMEYIAKKQRK